MKVICTTLVRDNVLGEHRLTGACFTVSPVTFEDEMLIQFIQDNAKQVTFRVGRQEWKAKG
jgi:hypothetical protein